jgi:hypothetical protein
MTRTSDLPKKDARPLRVLAKVAVAGLSTAAAVAAVPAVANAATPAHTGVAASASVASHNPHGSFAVGVRSMNHIHVRGKAYDPDTSKPIRVAVQVNHHTVAYAVANKPGHVFDVTLPARKWGKYTVVVRALNVGGGNNNPVIGTHAVSLVNPSTRNPWGEMHVAGVKGRIVTLTGSTADPDKFHSSLVVKVQLNGRIVKAVRSNWSTHRYTVRTTLPYGRTKVSTIAYNVGRGTGNPHLGTAYVTVPKPGSSSGGGSYGGNQAIAASLLPRYGWNQSQMQPLVNLWNRESGWNPGAANPSGAYGIPQSLPGSKMAAAGPDWATNPKTQITWGLSYIKGVYGSPAAAWAHSEATNWY